ncbi:MAG: class I SAM-dependent methyltransferase [Rhodospirillaceae bacterium]|nr:class I SAM-dependent methyltransferase [Rhodospirillaceae bacterium]
MNRVPFSAEDKSKVIHRYADRFAQHGYSEKALGWGEKGRQLFRYRILAKYWDLTGKTVLDVGAGFGDFYKITRERGAARYIGLELMPEFVAKGRELYGANGDFELREHDIAVAGALPANDLVFISGLFNFKLETGENYAFIEDTLRKCFASCAFGVSANFVTDRVDFRDPVMFYADPSAILAIALKLTRKVALLQDYFPFEYTVHLSKDDAFDPATSIFKNPRT